MTTTPQIQPRDPYNESLLANVHPADWINPPAARHYNLVVLGAGTAGLVAAAGAAGLGARVALVERALMGGDCLNVGCVPSKALIRAARACAAVRGAAEFGVAVDGYHINFPAIMERMRRLRASISPHDSADRFRRLGVDSFFGEARFTGPDAIAVAGQTLRFSRAVIATGTRPADPPVPGLAGAGFLTNETVFSLTELPARLAVIGGGPIGCELAQAFARFGARVTQIDRGAQLLHREDQDAARIVQSALARDGVELRLGGKILRALPRGPEKILHLEHQGTSSELVVDEILVAVGRSPNVEGLNLEAAQVQYDATVGVHVDDRLRTSNLRIFAAGDICSRYKFTHAADALARIALQNALFPGRARASALTIPWCTYTDPEIAHVGLYESEAQKQGISVQTFTQEMSEVDRAILDGDTDGFVRVHVCRGTDRILGATVVARHAGEMISELTLAITARCGLRTLARTIHPYPTQAEAIKKIGDAYNRTRLTPVVQWLMKKWLSWRR